MDQNRRLNTAADKIIRLSSGGHDVVTFWRACTPVLSDAVPHYLAPCHFTLDPASRLVTSHYQEGLPEFPPGWLAEEYAGDDVNKLSDVARMPAGISTLHEATAGDPSSSPRWHANMSYGADQEMIVALRSRVGDTWGAIGLYREPGRPLFDRAEQAFLESISAAMADGVRRGLLVGEAVEPDRPEAPGLVVLDQRYQPESLSPNAAELLDSLPDGDRSTGRLPPAVLAVAGRTAAAAAAHQADPVDVARVRTASGRWLILHGVPLRSGDQRSVAVIIEPASPSRIAPLLMAAHGLTEREQEVTQLVLQGYATRDIAEQLQISPLTVQRHLQHVFDKTGVRSRRDLVGKVFFTHYEPRFRDNERRAADSRPLRGGPAIELRVSGA